MTVRILVGDVRARLAELADESVHTVVTSPPYFGLRDYGTAAWGGGSSSCDHLAPLPGGTAASGLGAWDSQSQEAIEAKVAKRQQQYRSDCGKCGAQRVDSQLGLEETPWAYLETMVAVFREIRRVLRRDGTLWLNMGDSFANDGKWGGPTGGKHAEGLHGQAFGREKRRTGLKPKDLMLMPARLAIALQDDGWWVRRDVIWSKPNPMPESTEDRPTTAHEYLFLLTKAERYFYDSVAIMEPISPNTHLRVSQATYEAQYGSTRANGGTRADRPTKALLPGMKMAEPGSGIRNNSSMNAALVAPGRRIPVPGGWDTGDGRHDQKHRTGRRRGVPPRHEQYDSSDQSGLDDVGRGFGANKRSVWEIATAPFDGEFCRACKVYYPGREYRHLRPKKERQPDGKMKIVGRYCLCGALEHWLSHFATFPPDLVEPCILAGTSERGCCPDCGAPWVRVADKSYAPSESHGGGSRSMVRPRHDGREDDLGDRPHLRKIYATTGWMPGCDCKRFVDGPEPFVEPGVMITPEPIPCTVLDPFSGAGTTALVADRLGRDAVGIELNPDYARMAEQRLAKDAGLFADTEVA